MKRAHVTSLPEPNVLEYKEENRGVFKTLFSRKYGKRLTVLFCSCSGSILLITCF